MQLNNRKGYVRWYVMLSITIFISFLAACNRHKSHRAQKILSSNTSAENIGDQLSAIFKPVDTTKIKKDIKNVAENVRYAYQLNEYLPIWLNNDQPSDAATSFLKELADIKWDGLDPEHYQYSALSKQYDAIKGKQKPDVALLVAFDTSFTHSYLAAASDLLIGVIKPEMADSLWYHKNDTIWNAPQAIANMDRYPGLDEYRSLFPAYKVMRDEYRRYHELAEDSALLSSLQQLKGVSYKEKNTGVNSIISDVIKKELPWIDTVANDSMSATTAMLISYQRYQGLRATGRMDSNTFAHLQMQPGEINDKIKANMERVRWMQREFGDLYILVDVPLAELFFRKDGQDVMHMHTVVGKPERQTPSLGANMANVVINPPWGVPPTILKKDVLPGITQSGQKYLAKKGLKAYDRKGNKINAASITPKNYKNYTYKQDPGDDNSLGYVKFNLPNPWDIYLHDTPHRGDFGKSVRTLSSGCIRLQQPQEMALYILADLEKKRYTQERLDSVIKTHKTRWEILKNKIPVHIVYITALEDTTGKHLRLINDVYKRDGKLISLLK